MDLSNNRGEKIAFTNLAGSNEKVVSVNRVGDVTTVTTRNRNTGSVSTEIFVGDSPPEVSVCCKVNRVYRQQSRMRLA